MEAIPSSVMSVNVYRTRRSHIPEGSTIRSHRCENFRSSIRRVGSPDLDSNPIGSRSASYSTVLLGVSHRYPSLKLVSIYAGFRMHGDLINSLHTPSWLEIRDSYSFTSAFGNQA
jgi:hypothetical protein